MSKLVVKGIVLVISYFDHTIFSSERITVINTYIMMMNFNCPIIKVGTIEKVNPIAVTLRGWFISGFISVCATVKENAKCN
jgi:hypothetical protein